ncbi:MAG TPA: tRNA epoxyqueuosine(34) reductase QueG [Burkholderiales bacterium]|nr:tRNA epoxyqueuosine(34) reductase QueG [Burkholderiales bacterium]
MSAAAPDAQALKARIRARGLALGFDAVGFAGADLGEEAQARLQAWLEAGYHGEMDYMARHGLKRVRPAELVPGTLTVITVRMNYLAAPMEHAQARLQQPGEAYVSVYAHGRDYHKVMRNRLQHLAEEVEKEVGAYGYRVFTDSAPVAEVELGAQSGLGWRGKHTLLLNREAGSMFFLGEIYTTLALPADAPVEDHCGSCFVCSAACPTGAIVAPHTVDARRCISYLTIELKGAIPEELRPLLGNRIYGCDDCQLACPWNKFAQLAAAPDFQAVRNGLDSSTLAALFAWSEAEFSRRMAGSAILRIGYQRWLRNIAVALGNGLRSDQAPAGLRAQMRAALAARADDASPLVREHVAWALQEEQKRGT